MYRAGEMVPRPDSVKTEILDSSSRIPYGSPPCGEWIQKYVDTEHPNIVAGMGSTN